MKHPAKYSKPIVESIINKLGDTKGNLLDPFAGTGLSLPLFEIPGRKAYGVEIEKPWADLTPNVIHGDSTHLPFRDNSFQMVVTSPTYGNRFADHHKAKDASTRRSYTHDLQAMTGDTTRQLNANNTGLRGFNDPDYKDLHTKVWAEVTRVGAPGCLGLFNWSDYLRTVTVDGKKVSERVPVSVWHLNHLVSLGWEWCGAEIIPTQRSRHGQNGDRRVDGEWLITLRLAEN